MARHDIDHDEDRGRYSDWRDDDAHRHRGVGGGRDSGDPRERHFSRFDESYSSARERGAGNRDHERWDPGAGTSGWHRDEREPVGGWYPRGHYDRPDWRERESYRPSSEVDRRRGPADFMEPDRWSTVGPFVGRGPRGYRRSDARIKEDVCDALMFHGRIDASDVEVSVEEGVVTLRGTVDTRHTKRLAEDVVEEVHGVRDVHNHLGMHRMDGDVASHRYTAGGQSYQALEGERGRYMPERDSDQHDYSSPEGEQASSVDEGRFVSAPGGEYRARIHAGMEVVGSDGDGVGDVKEVSNNSFLVDRSMKRDLYVPFSAVRSMSGNRITLDLQAHEVDDQGWATPDLMGSSSEAAH